MKIPTCHCCIIVLFLFLQYYESSNRSLVSTSSFALGSGFFFFFQRSHYIKQEGYGLEIVRDRDIKVEKENKEISMLYPFSNIYFIPFMGVKAENLPLFLCVMKLTFFSPVRWFFLILNIA